MTEAGRRRLWGGFPLPLFRKSRLLTTFAEPARSMGYALHKLGAKIIQADSDRSEQGRGFHRPKPALSPRRPPELLPITPLECCRRLEANADAAALVDIGAFG